MPKVRPPTKPKEPTKPITKLPQPKTVLPPTQPAPPAPVPPPPVPVAPVQTQPPPAPVVPAPTPPPAPPSPVPVTPKKDGKKPKPPEKKKGKTPKSPKKIEKKTTNIDVHCKIKADMPPAEYARIVKDIFTNADTGNKKWLTVTEMKKFSLGCADAFCKPKKDVLGNDDGASFVAKTIGLINKNGDNQISWDEAWNFLKNQRPTGKG